MNGFLRFYSLIIFLLVLIFSMLQAQNNAVRDLYQQAKVKCYSHEWTTAVSLFEELLENHPGSKYEDDALFWIAYSLEKIPDKKSEAFVAFNNLIEKYPESPWVDDALGHQIELAEHFVKGGNESYRTFLYEELKIEINDIRFRAAISLGRIGDPRALPVLRDMLENEDYGALARDLAAILQINRMSVDDTLMNRLIPELNLIYQPDKTEPQEDAKGEFLWFGSARYSQYHSMLKKEEEWSDEELTDFALWHILTTDKFEEYRSLSINYDKKEWLRKYWKRKDPTPTSPENERQIEFLRRVQHARANFSALWEYSEFKYMPDQFLRPGALHAPWDARGELYIKYGEPDARSEHSYQTEGWIFYRYAVDFLVKLYMTNIYGKAIHAGEMSIRRHNIYGQKTPSILSPYNANNERMFEGWNSVDAYIQANFIYKNEMRFEYDYQAAPIKNIKLTLESSSGSKAGNLIYHYQIPAGEFKLLSSTEGQKIRYREVYCIVDKDLRDVARNEVIRNISKIPDEDYLLKETIILNLPAGKYTLFLRLEDKNDKRLGIFYQEFQIEKI